MNKESYLRKLIKEEISFIYEGIEDDIKRVSDEIQKLTIKKADLEKKKANLMENEPLNEKELNETPYIGGERDTTGLGTVLVSSANRLKKEDPNLTVQDIAKILKNKKSRLKRAPELEKALRYQEEKLGGSPNYTPDLGPNQTIGAVEKALGLKEPKEPKEPKTKSEPKSKTSKETSVKSDKSSKPKPSKKEDEDDEEVEDNYYNDDDTSLPDEDADDRKATKAAAKDKTSKSLGNTPDEKKIKFNQFLSSVKKNKGDKAKIDAILKLAQDKLKFSGALMNDLRRAAGRDIKGQK
jgi:hypothetical protein